MAVTTGAAPGSGRATAIAFAPALARVACADLQARPCLESEVTLVVEAIAAPRRLRDDPATWADDDLHTLLPRLGEQESGVLHADTLVGDGDWTIR